MLRYSLAFVARLLSADEVAAAWLGAGGT
jgi:hypothetical protein